MRRGPTIALPLIAGTLALALAAVVILTAGNGSSTAPRVSSNAASGFDGAALSPAPAAPGFSLTDQAGRRVSLAGYRGRPLILTFLYSTCGASCIVIAQQIRGALDELGHPVPVIIVSADPAADTPAHVRAFLESVSLSGRVEYLSGTPAALRAIWRDYRVPPAGAGGAAFGRYATVILLDGRGAERVLFQEEQLTPEALAHDIRRLEAG